MFRTTGVLYCHSGLVVKVAAMTNVQACYGEHPTVERPSNDKYAFLCVFHTFKRKTVFNALSSQYTWTRGPRIQKVFYIITYRRRKQILNNYETKKLPIASRCEVKENSNDN